MPDALIETHKDVIEPYFGRTCRQAHHIDHNDQSGDVLRVVVLPKGLAGVFDITGDSRPPVPELQHHVINTLKAYASHLPAPGDMLVAKKEKLTHKVGHYIDRLNFETRTLSCRSGTRFIFDLERRGSCMVAS